ncbi:MAG: hypothetical protein HDKAJFGB_02243 [Anaerolineae bacterium]|nr:hypothetical protein [Anaerolineae bacterium]
MEHTGERFINPPQSFAMEKLKPCQFRQVDAHGRILCQLVKNGDRQVSAELCRACPVQAINCQNLRAELEKQVSTPLTVRFATGRVEVWNDAPTAIAFKQAACAAKTIPIHSPRDCAGCPLRLPNVIPQNGILPVARAQSAAAPPVAQAAREKRAPQPAPTKRAAPAAPQVATASSNNAASETISATTAALVARAQATAQKKAQEQAAIAQAAQRIAAEERAAYAPEPKSKIIQIQNWLAGQLTRKQMAQPLAVAPDADGVSDIVYAPLGNPSASAFQETVDYERCVGWTD